jgi:hypothetical protein
MSKERREDAYEFSNFGSSFLSDHPIHGDSIMQSSKHLKMRPKTPDGKSVFRTVINLN